MLIRDLQSPSWSIGPHIPTGTLPALRLREMCAPWLSIDILRRAQESTGCGRSSADLSGDQQAVGGLPLISPPGARVRYRSNGWTDRQGPGQKDECPYWTVVLSRTWVARRASWPEGLTGTIKYCTSEQINYIAKVLKWH